MNNLIPPPMQDKLIPTSTSQSTDSSKAFFSNPFLRFEKVTCRLAAFSIRFISVFPLTIRIDDTPLSSYLRYLLVLLRGKERRLGIRRVDPRKSIDRFHPPFFFRPVNGSAFLRIGSHMIACCRRGPRVFSGGGSCVPPEYCCTFPLVVDRLADTPSRDQPAGVHGRHPTFHLEPSAPKTPRPGGGFPTRTRPARSRPEGIIAIAARHVASSSSCSTGKRERRTRPSLPLLCGGAGIGQWIRMRGKIRRATLHFSRRPLVTDQTKLRQ
ncbi:hypothetical protein MUK42_22953 [Musa troglodytarum]|uniref:Uncharacterized protein n=1 Tax=Musa troglodytarum TaxID=320322 RepID=A0A9E7L8P3_9LILI|nr:hypothetical protein MUK42_22953 [Musa troglodytarum]